MFFSIVRIVPCREPFLVFEKKIKSSRGAFETVRANPRKKNLSAERRDQPSPKSIRRAAGARDLLSSMLFPKTLPGRLPAGAPRTGVPMRQQGADCKRGKGSPRPSPRRWLRSKVASAEVTREGSQQLIDCLFLGVGCFLLSRSGIPLLLSRLSPSERTQAMDVHAVTTEGRWQEP
ncbi:hypothetical protein M426DRAFT_241723 [Hypoxylon sp. CI-4A]|nr:hypothetical protein M426DRAFT_241723 [Hypoxylon sp. CI-4A]